MAKGDTSAFGGVISRSFAQTRLYGRLDQRVIARAATRDGQKIIFGKLLWLSVQTVVLLTEIKRQTGPENQPFVELLGRLREGRCTAADFQLLNTRLVQNLDVDWQTGPWASAPIIVTDNAIKDSLNARMAQDFARRTGRKLEWYHCHDALARNKPNFDVPGGVVNGWTGTLVSVRYRVDDHGRRHAISCVVEEVKGCPLGKEVGVKVVPERVPNRGVDSLDKYSL
ncbi:hypothetical protein C8J57DRAFT_1578414 [Mycena rebaudengoi]|nr:hypothetical protein C8J57DRAFT_1578414 [Mycena rebaudengoi]